MTKRTAAEMLRELRAVRWEFDVLVADARCECRRDLKPGDPVGVEVKKGSQGVALHFWKCIPCATKARVEWTRVVADLEWRVKAEEEARRGIRPKVGEVWRSEYGNEYTVTRVDGYEVVLVDGPHSLFEDTAMRGWSKVKDAPGVTERLGRPTAFPMPAGDRFDDEDKLPGTKVVRRSGVTRGTFTATVKVDGLPEFTTEIPAGPKVTVDERPKVRVGQVWKWVSQDRWNSSPMKVLSILGSRATLEDAWVMVLGDDGQPLCDEWRLVSDVEPA